MHDLTQHFEEVVQGGEITSLHCFLQQFFFFFPLFIGAQSFLFSRQSSMKVVVHGDGNTRCTMLIGSASSFLHFFQQTSTLLFLHFLSLPLPALGSAASWRPPPPGSASTAVARKRIETRSISTFIVADTVSAHGQGGGAGSDACSSRAASCPKGTNPNPNLNRVRVVEWTRRTRRVANPTLP